MEKAKTIGAKTERERGTGSRLSNFTYKDYDKVDQTDGSADAEVSR